MSIDYYIYFVLDPQTTYFEKDGYSLPHEPFYVGKGKGKRYLLNKNRSKSFLQKISQINLQGSKPEYIKIGGYNEIEAFNAEKFFIEQFGRKRLNEGPLLNINEGGRGSFLYINENIPNGMLGKKHSEETKKKISERRTRLYGNDNPSKQPKTRAKISAALKGHPVSEATREKLRQFNLNKNKKELSL